MMMNPILNKELTIGSRSIKMSIHLMLYNLVLGAIAVITMMVLRSESEYGGADYKTLMALFPILATLQCFIILFMIPVLTASSIAGERERQTLDVMLTTPISPFSIVLGKVFTAMAQVLMYVLSSIPIMSLAFIIGGMSWGYILGFIAMVVYASFYVGAVGVYCSAKRKRTITSVISSFIIIALVMIVTIVAFSIHMGLIQNEYYLKYNSMPQTSVQTGPDYGFLPVWLLFNPAVPVANFVVKAFFGYSIADLGPRVKDHLPWIMYFLIEHWNVCAIIVNLLVALFFVWRASKNINPLKKVKRKALPSADKVVSPPQAQPSADSVDSEETE